MDYFEKQQRLFLSPIMYRERDTVYIFVQNEKNKYIQNKNGIYEQWENDFAYLLLLLEKIGIEISPINKEEYFTEDTVTLIGEINNWIEWLLKADYIIPEYEKKEIFTFNVNASMDKVYYSIAKLCDNANSVEKITDGYRVTFKGENIQEIELMYFLRSGWDWDIYKKSEGIIASYLVKYSKLYRMIISSREVLNQVEASYGYYTVPKAVKKIFYKIQKKEKVFQEKANELYTNMLLEKRVKSKWSNEYRLFELIKSHNYNAKYQYHCDWLGQQSLDIYIETERIGVEYQGEQHYKPIDIWGGEEALKENKERDKRKKNLCEVNNVRLLEWSYQIPVNDENVVQFMKENNIAIIEENMVAGVSEIKSNVMAPKVEEKKIINKKEKVKVVKNYIVQYDMQGNYVEQFTNIGDAARINGVSSTSISKVLRGERNSAANFIWKKYSVDEEIPERIEILFDVSKTNSGTAKRIEKVGKTGEIIEQYDSISDAARMTGISIHHIQNELSKVNSVEWKYL